MYQYRAQILQVINAETLYLRVDLGFHVRHYQVVHLDRVILPAAVTAAGHQAFQFVSQFSGKFVTLVTSKAGALTRTPGYLAEVTVEHEGQEKNLSDLLVAYGYAVQEGAAL